MWGEREIKAWTDDETERLKGMWLDDGWSSGVIAGKLGRTRNSVIGRVHRMGWSRPGASAPSMFLPRTPRLKLPPNRQAPVPSFRRPNWRNEGPVAPTHTDLEGIAVLSPNARPWIERGANQCAFPVGGQGADTLSCCNGVVKGLPYCRAHAEIAYSNEVRRRHTPDDKSVVQTVPNAPRRTFENWAAGLVA